MRKTDTGQLDYQTLENVRIRGVKPAQSGKSPEDVPITIDAHRTANYKWLALYREVGWNALKA